MGVEESIGGLASEISSLASGITFTDVFKTIIGIGGTYGPVIIGLGLYLLSEMKSLIPRPIYYVFTMMGFGVLVFSWLLGPSIPWWIWLLTVFFVIGHIYNTLKKRSLEDRRFIAPL